MRRTRSELRCDVCGMAPSFDGERRVCLCPKFQWTPKRGYAGTESEREAFERYGWRMATDAGGFVYWIGPGYASVVILYTDGTWAGVPEDFSMLEDFLDWYASGRQRSSGSDAA